MTEDKQQLPADRDIAAALQMLRKQMALSIIKKFAQRKPTKLLDNIDIRHGETVTEYGDRVILASKKVEAVRPGVFGRSAPRANTKRGFWQRVLGFFFR